jgi:hypothetical protein
MRPDDEAWARARRAKARLERAILDDPAVSLIDIGLSSPEGAADKPQEFVIRVHLRGAAGGGARDLPASVDSVRVVVVPGDYQIEG